MKTKTGKNGGRQLILFILQSQLTTVKCRIAAWNVCSRDSREQLRVFISFQPTLLADNCGRRDVEVCGQISHLPKAIDFAVYGQFYLISM